MSEEPIFCPDVFAELRAELGDEDTFDVLQGFLAETAAKMTALASGEPRVAMKRQAHTLKGTAATFGFMRVARAARELEAIAETAEASDLQASIGRLVAAFNECSALASEHLASGSSGFDNDVRNAG